MLSIAYRQKAAANAVNEAERGLCPNAARAVHNQLPSRSDWPTRVQYVLSLLVVKHVPLYIKGGYSKIYDVAPTSQNSRTVYYD